MAVRKSRCIFDTIKRKTNYKLKKFTIMSYFLRFTNQPEIDVQNRYSLHFSDLSVSEFSKETAASLFGCDEDSIVEVRGVWCQELEGLCGYLLEADNLEDAIEEVESQTWQFEFVGAANIFEGTYIPTNCPDGDVFSVKTHIATL